MSNIIKFGIAENYIPDWTTVNAIREIFQNFIDYGEYTVDVKCINEDLSWVVLSNDFTPNDLSFLKIGFSDKTSDKIGGHGEGMKLAGLIFERQGLDFTITTRTSQLEPCWYQDENIGRCYGIEKTPTEADRFSVSFIAPTEDVEMFTKSMVGENDTIYSSYWGDIVDKEVGNIYVGGLYVCNLTGLKYAYNFKPSDINLGRDRSVPSTWDIEYYSSKIIASYVENTKGNVTVKDIQHREFSYMDSYPDKISEKFKPVVEDGKIALVSGKTKIVDDSTVRKISKNPKVAAKIAKIKYAMKRTKSPHSVLKDFFDSLTLSSTKEAEAYEILKKAKNWKNK